MSRPWQVNLTRAQKRLRTESGFGFNRHADMPTALRRPQTVTLQQPAELLIVADHGEGDRQGVCGRLSPLIELRLHKEFILHPLVWPQFMIVTKLRFQDSVGMLPQKIPRAQPSHDFQGRDT